MAVSPGPSAQTQGPKEPPLPSPCPLLSQVSAPAPPSLLLPAVPPRTPCPPAATAPLLSPPPPSIWPFTTLFPCAATNRQLSSPAAGPGTAGEALCGLRDSCAQLVGVLPPHHASYQVAHSCCQITPLLAAGSSPFPHIFPLRLRLLLLLCSVAPQLPPKLTLLVPQRWQLWRFTPLYLTPPILGTALRLSPEQQARSSPGRPSPGVLLVIASFGHHASWAQR